METSTIIWGVVGLVVLVGLYSLVKGWIVIFNKFQYWINRAQRKFADISVIMQQRVDLINALAQVAKKYSIHEYKTIKDTIETRSRWTKDPDFNKRVSAAQEIENNFIKLQAVFERYPKVKADSLYKRLMGRGSLSRTESKLRKARLEYNRTVNKLNERVKIFPRNIVAWIHKFKQLDYLEFTNQESYEPKGIFED